jgi:NAD-dependent dihydropyrimidine dehydrogenase PreA subunit
VKAIAGERKKVHVIDQDACIKCGACLEACPAKVRAVVKSAAKTGRVVEGGARAPKDA